ncbi:MAG TPA: hypothetical protein VFS42_01925 [Burkholderiaceae bacterium]|nr:hypothetical protein [Burkholderiaceae bacterium]
MFVAFCTTDGCEVAPDGAVLFVASDELAVVPGVTPLCVPVLEAEAGGVAGGVVEGETAGAPGVVLLELAVSCVPRSHATSAAHIAAVVKVMASF